MSTSLVTTQWRDSAREESPQSLQQKSIPPSHPQVRIYNTMNTNNTFFNPGITVQVENESGKGWKINDPKEREKCKDKSAQLFRNCVEELAFAANESIKTPESSKYFTEIIPFYTNTGNGLAHSVHLAPGMAYGDHNIHSVYTVSTQYMNTINPRYDD